MSKWGFVDAASATRKFESDPAQAAEMVSDMSKMVLDQEKEISAQKDKIIEIGLQLSGARLSEGQLRGYIERVKETDPLGRVRDLLNERG